MTHEPIVVIPTRADLCRELAELRNQLREERLLTARLTRLLDDEEETLRLHAEAEEMRNRAAVQLGRALGTRRRAWRVLALNGALTVVAVGYALYLGLWRLLG